MKVLQINSVCGIGSTGRIATDIDKVLKEQGHESYIAYGRNLPNNCDNPIKIGNRLDNYLHVAKTRIFDKHGFGSKKSTKKFINKVELINPDVIHLHNIHGYYINIELLFEYLKEANKPVVWTLHDCWAFTGHCSHFDYIGCKKWETGCYGCPQKNSYPSSILIDNSKDNYTRKKEIFTGVNNLTIVTPSEWLAGLARESFLNEYPIKVINNGIDLDVFKPTKSDFRRKYNLENKFIILGVANIWGRNKGYDYFIELSKKLNKDEIVVIVGVTEKQKSQLPDNIMGITRTNSTKELAEIYSSSDVFINPTLSDTFPTTNLESLACGTPVITFNTGGSPECIDESCGFVVEKGSLGEMLEKIRIVKENGKSSYSQECRQRVVTLYDKSDKFNEYIKLYTSYLDKNI